jgi:hypothetical protein
LSVIPIESSSSSLLSPTTMVLGSLSTTTATSKTYSDPDELSIGDPNEIVLRR